MKIHIQITLPDDLAGDFDGRPLLQEDSLRSQGDPREDEPRPRETCKSWKGWKMNLVRKAENWAAMRSGVSTDQIDQKIDWLYSGYMFRANKASLAL